jgi:Asparagine synthase (glutamine-hydrolyzing)
MCDFAGIATKGGLRDSDLPLVNRMLALLSHRGPDEQRLSFDGGAAIGARRPSIIDLETGGQPNGNEDGSVQVSQNGEISADVELREIGRTLLATRLVDRPRYCFAVPLGAWLRGGLGAVYREWSSVRTQ